MVGRQDVFPTWMAGCPSGVPGATLHDVVIHDVRLGVWLAVQLGMLDIHVLLAVVLADDAEGLALAYVQRCLVEIGLPMIYLPPAGST